MIEEEEVYARSRTFIRATLSDNPDLARTNYAASLAALRAKGLFDLLPPSAGELVRSL
jgi:hypothetical protein